MPEVPVVPVAGWVLLGVPVLGDVLGEVVLGCVVCANIVIVPPARSMARNVFFILMFLISNKISVLLMQVVCPPAKSTTVRGKDFSTLGTAICSARYVF
jgi:hypothetical protein